MMNGRSCGRNLIASLLLCHGALSSAQAVAGNNNNANGGIEGRGLRRTEPDPIYPDRAEFGIRQARGTIEELVRANRRRCENSGADAPMMSS